MEGFIDSMSFPMIDSIGLRILPIPYKHTFFGSHIDLRVVLLQNQDEHLTTDLAQMRHIWLAFVLSSAETLSLSGIDHPNEE